MDQPKDMKVMDRLFVWNIILSALGATLCVGLWIAFNSRFPPQVPIWYGKPWGEPQLANPTWLLTIPFLTIFIGIFDLVVGRLISKDLILSGMLLSSGMVSQAILTLAFLRIVAIVI